jgi:hypothetical protein
LTQTPDEHVPPVGQMRPLAPQLFGSSCVVTVNVTIVERPRPSVTVRVSVFVPTSGLGATQVAWALVGVVDMMGETLVAEPNQVSGEPCGSCAVALTTIVSPAFAVVADWNVWSMTGGAFAIAVGPV